MAKICQLHADLKYYLCMQPVDMRKQFQGLQGLVNEQFGRYLTRVEAFRKITRKGMIQDTENQHKTDSLEEKYATVVGQLSGVTERLDHAERDLDLERATREDIIRQEVERRVAEELAKRQHEFDRREADLQKRMDKREEEIQKANALMQERLIADAKRQIEEARRKAEEQSVGKKAYLFCQTDDACNRAALMYSMLGACKVLGKNPERWLTYVLKHIGSTPEESLHILLPEEWEDNQ